jgi:NAD(P)-dependent dehydrogenase (short-subunit alcohol dehydrogenase family)
MRVIAGQCAVVTGGARGIGLATAEALVREGLRVAIVDLDGALAVEAARSLARIGPDVRGYPLDVRDQAAFHGAVARIEQDLAPIDVLVNNAGIMMVPAGVTVDGFELQFGTNHLGHFALTNLLLPHVTDRVVTLASSMHRSGSIDLEDLNWQRRPYNATRAYGQSKLANLLFSLELQRRLSEAGSRVRSLAAHPGWAATNLQGRSGSRIADGAMKLGNVLFSQSDERGALPTLAAATRDLPGGSYVGPAGFQEMRGYPTLVGRTASAGDPELARRLWEESARLTGIDYPAAAPA